MTRGLISHGTYCVYIHVCFSTNTYNLMGVNYVQQMEQGKRPAFGSQTSQHNVLEPTVNGLLLCYSSTQVFSGHNGEGKLSHWIKPKQYNWKTTWPEVQIFLNF